MLKQFGKYSLSVILVLMLSVVSLTACQKEEEPAAPAVPEAKTEPVPEAPAAVPAVESKETPLAKTLGLMPDSAAIGIAIPSIEKLAGDSRAIAERFTPDQEALANMIKEALTDMAEKLEVEPADSLPATLAQLGVDVTAPAAGFLSLTWEEDEAADEPAPEEDEPAPDEETSTEDVLKQIMEEDDEGESEPTPDMEMFDPSSELDNIQPLVAVVMSCNSTEEADTLGRRITEAGTKTLEDELVWQEDGALRLTEDMDGDPRGYGVFGKMLIFGDGPMLKDLVARIDEPEMIGYDTSRPDPTMIEVVRIAPLMEFYGGMLDAMESEMALDASPFSYFDELITNITEGEAGAEPILALVDWNAGGVEMNVSYDQADHPGLTHLMGEASPLELARAFPESTMVLLSTEINDFSKNYLKETMKMAVAQMEAFADVQAQMMEDMDDMEDSSPDEESDETEEWEGLDDSEDENMPPMAMDPNAMMMEMVNQYIPEDSTIDLLGDEVSIGFMGMNEMQMPLMIIAVGLSDAEQAEAKLRENGYLMMKTETYNESDIYALPMPLPIQIFFTVHDKALMISTDLMSLKSTLDHVSAGTASGLFQSIEPALDPDAPTRSVLAVRRSLIEEVIMPMVDMAVAMEQMDTSDETDPFAEPDEDAAPQDESEDDSMSDAAIAKHVLNQIQAITMASTSDNKAEDSFFVMKLTPQQ